MIFVVRLFVPVVVVVVAVVLLVFKLLLLLLAVVVVVVLLVLPLPAIPKFPAPADGCCLAVGKNQDRRLFTVDVAPPVGCDCIPDALAPASMSGDVGRGEPIAPSIGSSAKGILPLAALPLPREIAAKASPR